MAEITFKIPDDQLTKLEMIAQNQGISIEELLQVIIEDYLCLSKSNFTQVANYVLNKNAELYKRLA
ncbi:MAG TPA: DNA-binding protein [Nostocaceae cyanobacterium]|nr:DNA-binding protein [Nostocaceae cyanobacterium]